MSFAEKISNALFKLFVVLGIVLVVAIVVGAGLLFWMTPMVVLDPCSNRVHQHLSSPKDGHEAFLYTRTCGSAAEETINVTVLAKGKPLPSKTGNVFVCRDNPHLTGGGDTLPEGEPPLNQVERSLYFPVRIQWTGEYELEIRSDPRVEIQKQVGFLGEITVRYGELHPRRLAPAPPPA